MHDNGDDYHGDDGCQQNAAAIHDGRRALDAAHHGNQPDKRDAAHGVKGDAHVAVKLHLVIGAQLVRGPHEGKPCADEQAKRARVGAVVHARGVGIGVEQQRHLKC